MDWTMRNDEYLTILQEQKKQIQVFSDVIQKAQQLVTLISNDTKMCLKSNPIKNLIQLYNVSTQADLTNPKQPTKDAKENTDVPTNKDEQTNTKKKQKVSKASSPSYSIEYSTKNQETNTTTKHDKREFVSKATEPIHSSLDSKNVDNKVVQTVPEKNKKKLSTHLMPPVEISRELVTQKIPNINIDPQDKSAVPATDKNVGFEAVHHGNENEKLGKLLDIVRGLRDQETSTSSRTSKFIPDDQKNYAIVDEPIKSDGSENVDSENHITMVGTNMTDKIVKKLQDPEAQYMCKSYQVCDNPEKLETLPEIDSSTLSHIDDDVYKTYVNPNGKKSQFDSRSTRSTRSTRSGASANMSSNGKGYKKLSNTEPTVARKSSSSLTLNLDLGSKTSITSILTKNRESLHGFVTNHDQNKHSYFTDSAPDYSSRRKSNGKYEQKLLQKNSDTTAANKKSQKEFSMKIDSAVSASIKDYLASPRTRQSIDRIFRDSDFEGRRSKISRTSELSDSTEQMILSIDKVNIRKQSGFYGSEERNLALFDSSDAPKRNTSSWGKVINKSYDTIDEKRVISDMRVQTVSAIGLKEDSDNSKNSKGSSTTYNTDDAIKVVHLNDSVEETTTYCSYCTKCCFGKKRRVVRDDTYAKCSNRNSVQFLCSRESLKSMGYREGNTTKGKINTFEEINNERKQNFKAHTNDLNEKSEKGKPVPEVAAPTNGAITSNSNQNVEPKRSVKIEVPPSKTNTTARKDSAVETYFKSLTNPSSRSEISSKEGSTDFIKKSSQERNVLEENKREVTVLGLSVDQPNIASAIEIDGGCGDKSSFISNSKERIEIDDLDEYLAKQKIRSDQESCTGVDVFQKSDGEIMNVCDCSIGEMHVCACYPENVFLRNLHKAHESVVNRKVQNSNWISYYVSPVRTCASVPINDSTTDSLT